MLTPAFAAPSASGWIGLWSPGFSDPHQAGWLITVAYLGAALLCFRACRWARLDGLIRARVLWTALGAVLLLLGVNKQLDLQTLLIEVGKLMAQDQGWYEQRHVIQVVFVIAIAVSGVWAGGWLLRLACGEFRELRLALMGSVLLIGFIAFRASAFNHLDRLVGLSGGSLWFNSVLELVAITCIGAGSLTYCQYRSAVDRRYGHKE